MRSSAAYRGLTEQSKQLLELSFWKKKISKIIYCKGNTFNSSRYVFIKKVEINQNSGTKIVNQRKR